MLEYGFCSQQTTSDRNAQGTRDNVRASDNQSIMSEQEPRSTPSDMSAGKRIPGIEDDGLLVLDAHEYLRVVMPRVRGEQCAGHLNPVPTDDTPEIFNVENALKLRDLDVIATLSLVVPFTFRASGGNREGLVQRQKNGVLKLILLRSLAIIRTTKK